MNWTGETYRKSECPSFLLFGEGQGDDRTYYFVRVNSKEEVWDALAGETEYTYEYDIMRLRWFDILTKDGLDRIMFRRSRRLKKRLTTQQHNDILDKITDHMRQGGSEIVPYDSRMALLKGEDMTRSKQYDRSSTYAAALTMGLIAVLVVFTVGSMLLWAGTFFFTGFLRMLGIIN